MNTFKIHIDRKQPEINFEINNNYERNTIELIITSNKTIYEDLNDIKLFQNGEILDVEFVYLDSICYAEIPKDMLNCKITNIKGCILDKSGNKSNLLNKDFELVKIEDMYEIEIQINEKKYDIFLYSNEGRGDYYNHDYYKTTQHAES